MLLGKVIGTLTPCVVYKGLEDVPMLWIQPLDKQGNVKGEPVVACDATRMAGHAIVGIVDQLHHES
jgi:microcompartment protein CcmK/EutM